MAKKPEWEVDRGRLDRFLVYLKKLLTEAEKLEAKGLNINDIVNKP